MFSNDHIVITGGGKGIGAAIARKFAEQGAKKITLMGRTLEVLQKTAAGLNATPIVCDVSREDSVNQAFAQAVEANGPVTILVNNAGISDSNPLHRTTLEQFQRILNINLIGTFLCSRAVIEGMIEAKGGRIVNISSTAGLEGGPYISAYAASKHGVNGFTKSVALEVARYGITVNAICPGYTETGMALQAIRTIQEKTGKSEEEARAILASQSPQGRIIAPEEVADLVIKLCLPESGSITGQAILTDGKELENLLG